MTYDLKRTNQELELESTFWGLDVVLTEQEQWDWEKECD